MTPKKNQPKLNPLSQQQPVQRALLHPSPRQLLPQQLAMQKLRKLCKLSSQNSNPPPKRRLLKRRLPLRLKRVNFFLLLF